MAVDKEELDPVGRKIVNRSAYLTKIYKEQLQKNYKEEYRFFLEALINSQILMEKAWEEYLKRPSPENSKYYRQCQKDFMSMSDRFGISPKSAKQLGTDGKEEKDENDKGLIL